MISLVSYQCLRFIFSMKPLPRSTPQPHHPIAKSSCHPEGRLPIKVHPAHTLWLRREMAGGQLTHTSLTCTYMYLLTDLRIFHFRSTTAAAFITVSNILQRLHSHIIWNTPASKASALCNLVICPPIASFCHHSWWQGICS